MVEKRYSIPAPNRSPNTLTASQEPLCITRQFRLRIAQLVAPSPSLAARRWIRNITWAVRGVLSCPICPRRILLLRRRWGIISGLRVIAANDHLEEVPEIDGGTCRTTATTNGVVQETTYGWRTIARVNIQRCGGFLTAEERNGRCGHQQCSKEQEPPFESPSQMLNHARTPIFPIRALRLRANGK